MVAIGYNYIFKFTLCLIKIKICWILVHSYYPIELRRQSIYLVYWWLEMCVIAVEGI